MVWFCFLPSGQLVLHYTYCLVGYLFVPTIFSDYSELFLPNGAVQTSFSVYNPQMQSWCLICNSISFPAAMQNSDGTNVEFGAENQASNFESLVSDAFASVLNPALTSGHCDLYNDHNSLM